MTAKLFVQAILKFTLGVVLVGLLIFLPAGTFSFPGGWLLMGILFVPMFLAGIVMMCKNPALLERRLNGKERLSESDPLVAQHTATLVQHEQGVALAADLRTGCRVFWEIITPHFVQVVVQTKQMVFVRHIDSVVLDKHI